MGNREHARIVGRMYRVRVWCTMAGLICVIAAAKGLQALGASPGWGEALIIAFIVVVLVLDRVYWRCPICRAYLGGAHVMLLRPSSCRACNARL